MLPNPNPATVAFVASWAEALLEHPGVRRAVAGVLLEALTLHAAAELLTDREMATALGVCLKTFRRRYKERPALEALANSKVARAKRWPAGAVSTWWAANPAR